MSSLPLSRFIPGVLTKLFTFGDGTLTVSTILPPELLDRIIDHIHDDKPTLLALGLANTCSKSRSSLFKARVQLQQLSFRHFCNQAEARQKSLSPDQVEVKC